MSQTKRVYTYDGQGLYTGAYDAQQSPNEAPGVYITPNNSTEQEPTSETGFWPVFEDGKWVNKEDQRGIAWDTTTGDVVRINELGPLAENLTKVPKPLGTSTWDNGAWLVVNEPKITEFVEAVKADLGGIVNVNTLMRGYPALFPAIQMGNWSDVKALIIDAVTNKIITAEQYNAIAASAESNYVPLALPAL